MSLTGNAESNYLLRGKLNRLYELRGYSAYEVALINGFKGTEEEWLASLEGEKGDTGDHGQSPYIGENGNWWEWDTDKAAYVDTLVTAGYDELNRKNLVGLANMTTATETLDISAYERGSISTTTGENNDYLKVSRARSIDILAADYDKTLVAVNGAECFVVVLYDEDGTVMSNSSWRSTYTIPAGSRYRLMLCLDESSTTEVEMSEILANFYFVNEYEIVKQVGKLTDEAVDPYGTRIIASNFAELLPDMDSAVPNKIYSVYRTSACAIGNWPDGVTVATFVTLTPEIGNETYKVQLLFDISTNKTLVRTCVSSTWNAWSAFGTADEIAEVSGVSVNPYGTRISYKNYAELLPSMDDAIPNKIYSVLKTSTCAIENYPVSGSATFVTLTPEISGATFRVQMLFDITNNATLVRTCVSSTWNEWSTFGTANTLYVSTTGDDSAVGSAAKPLATFNEAISRGANIIIAEPGTYAQTISVSGVNNLTIRANKMDYDGSFQDALNPKIILDNSETLAMSSYATGVYRAEYAADANSRMYKVFVSKELSIDDGSGSEAEGYNANIWERCTDIADDAKLVPVATLAECTATEKTFFYDGTYIYVHPVDGSITDKTFVLPPDVDTIATFENCDNLVLEDIQTEYGYVYGINIQNCRNATLTDCNAHHNTNGEGFRLDYTNAKLTHCKAHKNRNDGFNMHENGHTEFANCHACYNGDDGMSHHQGCSGTVIGGEYSYNGSGGVTPAFGAEVSIYNAILRGNLYGIRAVNATGYANRTILAMGNVMTGNDIGLYVKKCEVVGINTIYGNTTDINLDTSGVYTDLAEIS